MSPSIINTATLLYTHLEAFCQLAGIPAIIFQGHFVGVDTILSYILY